MRSEAVLNDIRSRIEAGYPLLFLKTAEEDRWQHALLELSFEIQRVMVIWTVTQGLHPPIAETDSPTASVTQMLGQLGQYPENHLFVIKDFHPYLSDPAVLRSIRDLLPQLIEQRKTLLLMGPVATIPMELEKDAVRIELPLPDYDDLREQFEQTVAVLSTRGAMTLKLSDEDEDRLIKAVMGLTTNEARNAWHLVLPGRSKLDDEVFTTLIAEKRTLASGSDFLEFYDLKENAADIGGLDQLKAWLNQRAHAYSPRAQMQGVPLPKGVLLLGVQGCGKSLTARVTARLLSFPLIRLDVANLLAPQRGESEKNMRNVLNLVESISPAVLWLDEIEKGFAGVETDGQTSSDATMQRLFGTFLTWMSDCQKQIFVVATANSVENLPPEILRRGRFDELFFVDLPNFDERRLILEIHLRKRGWKPDTFDLEEVARRSEGFSGAELEQVIVTALIDAFGQQRVLSQDDLVRAWRTTVPLSVTMEDKIFSLRNWAQNRCRRATSDSRVTSMLDAEQRNDAARVSLDEMEFTELPSWAQLATAGQLKAGIVEYVRSSGDPLFPDLIEAFEPYMEVSGDQGLALRSNANTVIWAGLSQPLCELVSELISSKRLYIHPTDVERYKSVHKGIRLPVLKEPTDERLPRAAWLPSMLRTAPHPTHSARLSRVGRIKLG